MITAYARHSYSMSRLRPQVTSRTYGFGSQTSKFPHARHARHARHATLPSSLTCDDSSDNDMSVYDSPDKVANQISLYAARGTLIESEGPTWMYGTGSEHCKNPLSLHTTSRINAHSQRCPLPVPNLRCQRCMYLQPPSTFPPAPAIKAHLYF